MRVLVVDVNFDYKNPMYRQYYVALQSCMQVDFFGPGYVSREDLEGGIRHYMEEKEKYDAVLLGTYFVYSTGEKGMKYNAYHVHRNTLPYYHVNDAYQCCKKIFEELLDMNGIVKIFVYYEDTWSMPVGDRDLCIKLLSCSFYILSWPIEYMERYSAVQMRHTNNLTNYLYEIAKIYCVNYIPISLHGIGYHEIFVRNFKDREYQWCIPGNQMEAIYPERKKAHDIIQRERKKVWNADPYQLLSVATIRSDHIEWYKFRSPFEKVLSMIWGKDNAISSQPQMQYIAACREQYLESMRSSKMVYAESGIVRGFVRKYFETCACGAVLVAKRVPGMNEMGFVNDKNCIIIERYEDVVNVDKMHSEGEFRQIAEKGQKLIIEKHMFTNRAKSLLKTLEVILEGRYKGAFWKNGDYIIK